jgi:rRNA maturation endonuclease Nob1
MRDTAATGSVIAEQEVQKQRREICYACEFHDPEQHRCKSCGCMLSVKISMSANSCPQNKWPK